MGFNLRVIAQVPAPEAELAVPLRPVCYSGPHEVVDILEGGARGS